MQPSSVAPKNFFTLGPSTLNLQGIKGVSDTNKGVAGDGMKLDASLFALQKPEIARNVVGLYQALRSSMLQVIRDQVCFSRPDTVQELMWQADQVSTAKPLNKCLDKVLCVSANGPQLNGQASDLPTVAGRDVI